MKARLKGHRRGQLQLLLDAGARTLETAVSVSFGGGFRPVTLSAMIGEGLVKNAYLPFKGDARRRTSHYWLTPAGEEALAG
ncbi:MAG: hypothetical protein DI568_16680 [Sphingomonas sp.]|nr:MAG: hypothetical protein DI568_16680 [Sphingomonas sp.]